MKKTYISPEMEVVKIQMQQVLTSSPYDSTPVNANDVDSPEIQEILDLFDE